MISKAKAITHIQTEPPADTQLRRWTNVTGAWLGVGTAPGALLVGAGLAYRHGGPVPLPTIILAFLLMFGILWFQGLIAMAPPLGEGGNLTEITPRYFGPAMQRTIGALIAIGMIGWFGFNVGLGGAALNALLNLPQAAGPIIIGVPVLILSLMGLKRWNGLAALTTIAVLILVVLVVLKLSAREIPFAFGFGNPAYILGDAATFLGYVSVFSVRAPDFTANLKSRRDLLIADLLLCVPMLLISLAGVGLQQGTGSTDLVAVLAEPGGLMIGNLLVTLAVIAPTFTILYSGAPALRAAIGLNIPAGMVIVTVIGLVLSIMRFDLWLLQWLSLLAALLPPLVIPMATEASRRRRGHSPRLVPLATWLPGSIISLILTLLDHNLSTLAGLAIAAIGTSIWGYMSCDK